MINVKSFKTLAASDHGGGFYDVEIILAFYVLKPKAEPEKPKAEPEKPKGAA